MYSVYAQNLFSHFRSVGLFSVFLSLRLFLRPSFSAFHSPPSFSPLISLFRFICLLSPTLFSLPFPLFLCLPFFYLLSVLLFVCLFFSTSLSLLLFLCLSFMSPFTHLSLHNFSTSLSLSLYSVLYHAQLH